MQVNLCAAMAIGISAGISAGVNGWVGLLVFICCLASFVLGMIAMFNE